MEIKWSHRNRVMVWTADSNGNQWRGSLGAAWCYINCWSHGSVTLEHTNVELASNPDQGRRGGGAYRVVIDRCIACNSQSNDWAQPLEGSRTIWLIRLPLCFQGESEELILDIVNRDDRGRNVYRSCLITVLWAISASVHLLIAWWDPGSLTH
jgi:hypothetical protein